MISLSSCYATFTPGMIWDVGQTMNPELFNAHPNRKLPRPGYSSLFYFFLIRKPPLGHWGGYDLSTLRRLVFSNSHQFLVFAISIFGLHSPWAYRIRKSTRGFFWREGTSTVNGY